MLTYAEGRAILARPRRKPYKTLKASTILFWQDTSESQVLCIQFHSTVILKITWQGIYTLNTSGHESVTTKGRLNEYGPVRVNQRNYIWYAGGFKFFDGIQFHHTGQIVTPQRGIICPSCEQDNLPWEQGVCIVCSDKLKDTGERPW